MQVTDVPSNHLWIHQAHLLCQVTGHGETETAARSAIAHGLFVRLFYPNAPPVHLDDVFAGGQTQASAAVHTGGRVVNLVKEFKDALPFGWGHARSGVGDGDEHLGALIADRDRHSALLGCELDGVVEQVEKHPF